MRADPQKQRTRKPYPLLTDVEKRRIVSESHGSGLTTIARRYDISWYTVKTVLDRHRDRRTGQYYQGDK